MSAAPPPEGGPLPPPWSTTSLSVHSPRSSHQRQPCAPISVGTPELDNGTPLSPARSLQHGVSSSLHAAASESSPGGSNARNPRGTVLVVDDMAINRAVLGQMVRKAGLDVVEATNGAEAMEQVATHPPGHFQCILMDLQMPVVDGWQATQQIRAWEAGYSRANSAMQLGTGMQCGSPPGAPCRMQTYMTDDARGAGWGRAFPAPSRSNTCLTDDLQAGLYQPPSRSGTCLTDDVNMAYPPPTRSQTGISGFMAPTAEEDEYSVGNLAGQSSNDTMNFVRQAASVGTPSARPQPLWHGSAVGLGAGLLAAQPHAFIMPPIASVQHLADAASSSSRANSLTNSLNLYRVDDTGNKSATNTRDPPSSIDFLDGGQAFLTQHAALEYLQPEQGPNCSTPEPDTSEAETSQHSRGAAPAFGGAAAATVSFHDMTDTDLAALLNPALLELDMSRGQYSLGNRQASLLPATGQEQAATTAAAQQQQPRQRPTPALKRSVNPLMDDDSGAQFLQGSMQPASYPMPLPRSQVGFSPGKGLSRRPPYGSARDKLHALQQQQRSGAEPVTCQSAEMATWQRPREGLAVPSPQLQQAGFDPRLSITPSTAIPTAGLPLPQSADVLRRMRTHTESTALTARVEGRASSDLHSRFGYGRSQSSMLTSPHGSYPPPRIPIVACTAEILAGPPVNCQSYPQDTVVGSPPVTAQQHALSCGVDECVRKPLSFEELCGIFKRYAVIPSDWENGPAGSQAGPGAHGRTQDPLKRGLTSPAPGQHKSSSPAVHGPGSGAAMQQ